MKHKKNPPLIDPKHYIRIDSISTINEIPQADAVYNANPDPDEASLIGLLTNPIYCGIPPYEDYKGAVSEKQFLQVTEKMCKDFGVVRYLNNLVYMLQNSFRDCTAQKPTKSDDELKNLPIYLSDLSLDSRNWILNIHQEFKKNPKENMKIILQSLREAQFTFN